MARSVRSALRLVVLVVGVLVLACPLTFGAPADPLEKEVVIVTTGGVFEQLMKEHFYDPFTKATGVNIVRVAATNAEMWAKVKAMSSVGAIEWDIVDPSVNDLIYQRQFLARLDCAAIPNAAAQGVAGTCQEHGLLRTIGGNVVAYDSRAFAGGKHPTNWAEFWDVTRFPGPRALPNAGNAWEVLAAALLADGVPPDKLFPMDLDRAFRKLDQISPHVRVWWKTGDQSQQIFRDGEVVLAMMWSGRALSLKASGAPVEVVWNQGMKNLAYWGVLKGGPNPRAAAAFLNFFMDRPEAHLAFSRRMFYDTSNRLALNLLPDAERKASVTHETNWNSMIDVSGNPWVAQNRARILERWNAWLAK